MPSYKLTYFNGRGRGEVARLLFAQAGVKFEDDRISFEDFAKLKPDSKKCPPGFLPLLEIDGKLAYQSKAIDRYLAREFNLYGKNNMQALEIDIHTETVRDLFDSMIKFAFAKEEAEKEKFKGEFATKCDKMVPLLVEALQKNSQGKGFFVGNSMTYLDIAVFDFFDGLQTRAPELVAKFPAIEAFVQRISKQDKIAAWLAKRPQTQF